MDNILITSPSLDTKDNVSGISSITRLLMSYNTKVNYYHFVLGRKDNSKRGLFWLIIQMKTPFKILTFVRKHHISAVHFNIGFEPLSLLRDVFPYFLLYLKGLPLYLHIHGGRYISSIPDSIILRSIIKFFLKKSTEILVLSSTECDYLSLHYPFLFGKKIWVIPNAVEIPKENELKKDYQSEFLNILYLGRIDRKKGLETIARSLNELSDKGISYRFYLCGVGPDKDWFIKQLNGAAYASIIDKGLVYGEMKKEVLSLSHIFLLPSFFEGLPMALLESMGNAVVPIVTPVGSMSVVVQDHENGFLINDDTAITDIIVRLNQERNLLAAMAFRSRKTIMEQFSITRYVDMINEIYCSV